MIPPRGIYILTGIEPLAFFENRPSGIFRTVGGERFKAGETSLLRNCPNPTTLIDNFLAFRGPGMYAGDETSGWISSLTSNIC